MMDLTCSILLLFACCEFSFSDKQFTSKGKEFILAFMENIGKDGNFAEPIQLYISTLHAFDVKVKIKAPMFLTDSIYHDITVKKGVVDKVILPKSLRSIGNELASKAVYVTADNDITIHAVNQERPSTASFLAFPVSALGLVYLAVTWYPPNVACQMIVAAIANDTNLAIELPTSETFKNVSLDGTNYTQGETIYMELQSFNTLQIQSKGDLSGSKIISNKPIAVFSGNVKTAVNSTFADHLVGMILPVAELEQEYITFPFPNTAQGYVIRIITPYDDTTFNISCGGTIDTYRNNNERDVITILIADSLYCIIRADRPIQVTEYLTQPNDPSMLQVLAVNQFETEASFSVPDPSNRKHYTNYLILLVMDSISNSWIIDGVVKNIDLVNITGSGYSAAVLEIDDGDHFITHAHGNAFGGYLCGTNAWESYAYQLAMIMRLKENIEISTSRPETTSQHQPSTYTQNPDCHCICPIVEVNNTKLENLRKSLTVNKTQTVAYRMSKTSAPDPRLSATLTGSTLSISILGSFLAWIIIPDLIKAIKIIQNIV